MTIVGLDLAQGRENVLIHSVLDSIFGSYILDSRPSPEFQYEAGKNKLINLDIASGNGPEIVFTTPEDDHLRGTAHGQSRNDSGVGRQGKVMRLVGLIDLDSRLSVSSRLYSPTTNEANSSQGQLCWRCFGLYLTPKKCHIPPWR